VKYLRIKGFSMLEVLLAVVVITIAGMGIYSLFNTGVSNSKISDATGEAVQIANVYTDLASSNLTASDDDLPTLLQNSGRLSSKYFSSSSSKDGTTAVKMNNAFGSVSFASVTAYSFAVTFPLGCSTGDAASSSSVPGQFFSKVKDLYSCTSGGSKNYADCAASACTNGKSSSITLYFNMNH
jgi:prepilin-type N-terminal cleavage/methylation domain-containing protein